jgi:hypothetical protein
MARTWKAGAIKQGREDGDGAAGWWIQENGGGRDTRGAKALGEMAERVLTGIDDGDPEILDAIPRPDLSGEWADRMTADDLVEGLTGIDRADWTEKIQDARGDLCDAYEDAFDRACQNAILKHLKDLVRAAKQAA